MRVELWFVLAFAFVINLFVVIVFAESYYTPDGFGDVGLQVGTPLQICSFSANILVFLSSLQVSASLVGLLYMPTVEWALYSCLLWLSAAPATIAVLCFVSGDVPRLTAPHLWSHLTMSHAT